MKFLNNIKFNYHVKLLEDYLSNDNAKAYSALKDIFNNEPSTFIKLFLFFENKYLQNQQFGNFYDSRLIWINSFDFQDTLFLNQFLNYYLSRTNNNFENINYSLILNKIINEKKINDFQDEIKFDHFVRYSNLFQNLILFYFNNKNIFLNSRAAFFESTGGKYFTYPNLTQSYIFIVRNPYALYNRYKINHSSNQFALNEIFNFNQELVSEDNSRIYENRQSWNTHTKSWIDPNVKSTFNGKIIKFEDLAKDPEDILIQVLYHLKESGMNLDLNFDLVREFLNTSSLQEEKNDPISNQEKKSLIRDIDNSLLDFFKYNI